MIMSFTEIVKTRRGTSGAGGRSKVQSMLSFEMLHRYPNERYYISDKI